MSTQREEANGTGAGEMGSQHSAFSRRVGVVTMIMGVLSAVGALLAGITANDILLKRTAEIVDRQDLVSARVRVEILETKVVLLQSAGRKVDEEQKLIDKLRRKMGAEQAAAEMEEGEVKDTIPAHELFSVGVALMSIAITLSGLAVASHNRRLHHLGILIAFVATGFFGAGAFSVFQ